jgi:hypothetical protein
MTMVKLGRAYASIHGAPVISAVDPAIFALRYYRDCMACGFCHDACCTHGVDIDVENVARLRALPPDFANSVGTGPEVWFTEGVAADAEFPGGAHLRTRTREGACVFLDRAERGCKIHAYCLANGIDYHLLKPMVSVLFPVTFEHGALVPSSEVADASLICSGAGPTLYEGVRAELAHYFGDGLVLELDALDGRA